MAAAPAEAAFPGHNGHLAFGLGSFFESTGPPFTSTEERAIQDSSGRTLRGCVRKTDQPDQGDCSIYYSSPAYSPDGARVVFDADRALGLMDADGKNFRLLSVGGEKADNPAFSPSGTQVVFARYPSNATAARSDLYVMRPSTGHMRRLTYHGGFAPVWSSRGTIAFTRAHNVYVVRSDGHGLRRITYRRGNSPAWSPHGTKLVFVRDGRLYIVGVDGRRLHVVGAGGAGTYPKPDTTAWSPDGRKLAFDSAESGISVIGTDGRGLHQVREDGSGAEGGFAYFQPDWQPVR